MKCVVCGNSHFSDFIEKDRPVLIILRCAKCGAVVEIFKLATIEERQLLAGSE